jgi:UDP-N-acetylglucosamine--N-acetylmuramyl-(pentapeptide) pyrophosphoryl-undecaprenol N-acetylglucosamine transferase
VYPALAVLQALPGEERPSVLWVGSVGGMERELVERSQVPFEAIPAAGVHGVGLRSLPGNLLQLARGYRHARRILKRFQPDVLLFTGGYVAVPMALAGLRFPSVLYVPDIEPGLALKVLARLADRIAVTAEDSRAYLPSRSQITVTGYPVRPDLAIWEKPAALQVFGFNDQLPVLLVFGGSSGARSINRALLAVLPELLKEMQIIHVSGKLDWAEVEGARGSLSGLSGVDADLVQRYRAYPYLHAEMGAALAASDLALSRAGASSLGEFPQAGLPAILVPYPFAWRYQKVNAGYLERRGAAVVMLDQDLPQRLAPMVSDLIRDTVRLEQMRLSMRSLAHPDAARAIAGLLLGFTRGRDRERKIS